MRACENMITSYRTARGAAFVCGRVLCMILWIAATPCGGGTVPSEHDGGVKSRTARALFPFEIAPAYHVIADMYEYSNRSNGLCATTNRTEVWAVRGLGRREERRVGVELVSVIVDTSRARFAWDVAGQRVAISRGSPAIVESGELADMRFFGVDYGGRIRDAELTLTSVFTLQEEMRNGIGTKKLTMLNPVCPTWGVSLNAHGFDPQWYLRQSGTQFLTREFWFDAKTGRYLGKRCGCSPPWAYTEIEYPAPDTVAKSLFVFRRPAGVAVEVADPELRKEADAMAEAAAEEVSGARLSNSNRSVVPARPEISAVVNDDGRRRRVSGSQPLAALNSIKTIQSELLEQQKLIESLYVRVRRESKSFVTPAAAGLWSRRVSLPKCCGWDEVLFGFKGARRYSRFLALDYRAGPLSGGGQEAKEGASIRFDEATAWDTRNVLKRTRRFEAPQEVRYSSFSAGEADDSLPAPEDLWNAGFAMPDPTGSDEAKQNWQRMGHLVECLVSWPYRVAGTNDQIDGARCIVLAGEFECPLELGEASSPRRIQDRIWLDAERSLAVRRRETKLDEVLRRVSNSELVEVLPGVWLPRQSRTEVVGLSGSRNGETPLLKSEMKLCLWLVNQVPDELFDVALTPLEEAL